MRFITAAALTLCLTAPAIRADTYAVLPFFNVSKNKNLDWIGESISEAVAGAFSAEGLVTLDRDDRNEVYRRLSLRPYAVLTKASVVKIGEELDAEHVIYGNFDVIPSADTSGAGKGTLHISARVLDLKRMKQGPEFSELGSLEDLAGLETHLAWQTLQFLKPKTAPSESEFRGRHPAIRVDAVESYIRGLLASNADEKQRLFIQAVRLDGRYSQPCFELGRLYWQKKDYKTRSEERRVGKECRSRWSPYH